MVKHPKKNKILLGIAALLMLLLVGCTNLVQPTTRPVQSIQATIPSTSINAGTINWQSSLASKWCRGISYPEGYIDIELNSLQIDSATLTPYDFGVNGMQSQFNPHNAAPIVPLSCQGISISPTMQILLSKTLPVKNTSALLTYTITQYTRAQYPVQGGFAYKYTPSISGQEIISVILYER
jgi:hypothetical protein